MVTLDRVLGIAVANGAAAIVLALLAAVVGRFARRPAAAHALWVLVLLKLVTPPLWTVPVRVAVAPPTDLPRKPGMLAAAPVQSDQTFETAVSDAQAPWATSPPIGLADRVSPAPSRDREPASEPHTWTHQQPAGVGAISEAARSPAPAGMTAWSRWRPVLLWAGCAIWIGGTVAFLIIVVVRVVRFRRCLRYASAGHAELQDRAAILSKKMGIRRCPPVWLVPGGVSPMLWALGKARVLVPTELWGRLDDAERDALLAHELAHLRRRDHWVRWLEVLATAAYWWHPVCWWARRALREAEEQCCDAWVLWARPGGLQSYATALLETLDFLSARPGSDPPDAADRDSCFPYAPIRTSVPALASGMGQFHQLKRRFVMLKRGDVPRALTRGGLMAVFTLGGLLLPVVPTFAQVPTPATPAAKPETIGVADERSAREDDEGAAKNKPIAADDVKRDKLNDVKREKLNELKRARDADQAMKDNQQQAEMQKQLAESRMEVQKLAAALAAAEARMRKLEMAATGDRRDGVAYWDKVKDKAKTPTGATFKDPSSRAPQGSSFDGADRGDRLDAIEQQLQGLLQEIKSMRAERKAEDRYRKDAAKSKDGPKPTPSPALAK
jgi:beta-lactamase regulating signal transducer with metallopeptidase domain